MTSKSIEAVFKSLHMRTLGAGSEDTKGGGRGPKARVSSPDHVDRRLLAPTGREGLGGGRGAWHAGGSGSPWPQQGTEVCPLSPRR